MKKVIIIGIVLLSCFTSFSQTKQERKIVFDELKEWAVVKLTIAYMEDMYSFSPSSKGENGNKKEYETYKKLHNQYSTYTDDVDLDEIATTLETGSWSGAKENEFENYRMELFSEDREDFATILYVPSRTFEGIQIGSSSRTKALEEIQKTFHERLSSESRNEKYSELHKEEVTMGIVSLSSDQEIGGIIDNSSSTDYIIYAIFILFLLISLVFNFIQYKKNRRLNKSKKSSDLSSNKLTEKDMEIEKLKRENIRLTEERNNNIQETFAVIEQKEIIKDDIPSPTVEFTNEEQKTKETIYMPSPFQESTFANEDASDELKVNSLYQVAFDVKTKTGILSILEDADQSKALNSPESYLATVCIYDNEYSTNARSIKMSDAGEIKLSGEDWIVTKKVRIKFI